MASNVASVRAHRPTREDALPRAWMASAEDIIAEAAAGRTIVLVNDGAPHKTGALVVPAQFADPAAVNFMAAQGRGLICLAMTADRVQSLQLPLMANRGKPVSSAQFTASVEAREGVSTGISAADRARTIQVAIDGATKPGDLISPGHVFPIVAREGGVLAHAGYAEAAVDIARLANLPPSAVICEIMNEEGELAGPAELFEFANSRDLKIGAISDLIAYRRRADVSIDLVAERRFESAFGGAWLAKVYTNHNENTEHLALIHGDLAGGGPTFVRMHELSLFDDTFARIDDGACGLGAAMNEIARRGSGVIVIVRRFTNAKFSEMLLHQFESGRREEILARDYGVGARILFDLGVREVSLLTSVGRRDFAGLEGYGIAVIASHPLPQLSAEATPSGV